MKYFFCTLGSAPTHISGVGAFFCQPHAIQKYKSKQCHSNEFCQIVSLNKICQCTLVFFIFFKYHAPPVFTTVTLYITNITNICTLYIMYVLIYIFNINYIFFVIFPHFSPSPIFCFTVPLSIPWNIILYCFTISLKIHLNDLLYCFLLA